MSLETFFVVPHFFKEWWNNCSFPKNTKTSQCTFIAFAATLQAPGSLLMHRDVSHISHIVQMKTVENSTYQVSVVDNSEMLILPLT